MSGRCSDRYAIRTRDVRQSKRLRREGRNGFRAPSKRILIESTQRVRLKKRLLYLEIINPLKDVWCRLRPSRQEKKPRNYKNPDIRLWDRIKKMRWAGRTPRKEDPRTTPEEDETEGQDSNSRFERRCEAAELARGAAAARPPKGWARYVQVITAFVPNPMKTLALTLFYT